MGTAEVPLSKAQNPLLLSVRQKPESHSWLRFLSLLCYLLSTKDNIHKASLSPGLLFNTTKSTFKLRVSSEDLLTRVSNVFTEE